MTSIIGGAFRLGGESFWERGKYLKLLCYLVLSKEKSESIPRGLERALWILLI